MRGRAASPRWNEPLRAWRRNSAGAMASDDEHAQERETAYGSAPVFQPAQREPLLVRTVPVAGEVPRYRLGSARRDLLAGVTVTALALPSAMAYGELAGLSPVNGLYALLLPDDRLRAARLVAAARDRPGGVGVDARRRLGAAARRRGQRGGGRAGVDARPARRRLLPDRAGARARLDRRLPLPARADRLPARRRDRARDLAAREAARGPGRRDRAAAETGRGRAGAGRRERHHDGAERRHADRAPRPAPLHARAPRRAARGRGRDRRLVGARLRRPRDRDRRPGRRRAAAAEHPDAAARRRAPARAGGARRLPRLVRRRDPHRAGVRGAGAASTCAPRRSCS